MEIQDKASRTLLRGLRIADEHGERAKIVVPGLVQITGAETIGDHRCGGGIQRIRDGDVWVCRQIVIPHIRFPSAGPVAGLATAAYVFFVADITCLTVIPLLTRA